MCWECSLAVCATPCPLRAGGADVNVCEICGEPIAGDGAYSSNGQLVCEDCLPELTVSDLLNLCDLADVGELLEELGFIRT